jgi:protein phosphatase
MALLVLGVGAWLGVRSWVNRSYFVGASDGVVAIYRGLPTDFGPVSLNHVEERTTKSLEQVAELWRPRLEEGIRADTLEEARSIAARVPTTTGTAPTPTPSPTPTATAAPT